MPIVLIGDFGKDAEGVFTFRINATHEEDINSIINEAKSLGFKFWDAPYIHKIHKTWTVLLKLYIPKQLGYPDESA